MTLADLGEFGLATLRSLVVAEPQGYLALAAMAIVAVLGAIDLRRIRGRVQGEHEVSRRHDQAVRTLRLTLDGESGTAQKHDDTDERLEPSVAADDHGTAGFETSTDVTASVDDDADRQLLESTAPAVPREGASADAWDQFDDYLRGQEEDFHGTRVLLQVYEQRRLAAPDVAAVLSTARTFEPEGLERQRRTPNVLLLIGLAGTVLGLAATIGQIDVTALAAGQDGEVVNTLDSFGAVLRQLPTAFIATIWGILSALTFGHFVGRADASARGFAEDLEQRASRVWIPSVWPENVAVQYEDLNRSMRASNRVIEQTRSLMQSMTADFGATLQQTSEAMGRHVAELASVSDKTHQAFKSLSGQVTESVASLDRASGRVTDAMGRLESFHGEMQDAYGRMDQLFTEAHTESQQKVDTALQATRDQQAQFAVASDRTLVGIDAAADRMRDVADLVKRQEAGMESLRNSMLAAIEEGLSQSGASFRAVLDQATNGIAASAAAMAEPVDGLRTLVNDSLAGRDGSMAVQRLADVVSALADRSERLEHATKGLERSADLLAGHVRAAKDGRSDSQAEHRDRVRGAEATPRPGGSDDAEASEDSPDRAPVPTTSSDDLEAADEPASEDETTPPRRISWLRFR